MNKGIILISASIILNILLLLFITKLGVKEFNEEVDTSLLELNHEFCECSGITIKKVCIFGEYRNCASIPL